MNKIKLFCLPYAGGSAMAYHRWRPYLHENIELHPIELAGRGVRIQDDFYQSITEAVEDVYSIVSNRLNRSPYALFGHSMGSLLTYELAQKLLENGIPGPNHLFFSGRGAPDVHDDEPKLYHKMSEHQFKEELLELGGTPREFFEHPELQELLMPLLKNDFRIHEVYNFTGEIRPFESNITVMVGKEDDVSAEQIHGWRKHTNKICRVYYFEGEHFFLNQETENVVRIINETLQEEPQAQGIVRQGVPCA